MTQVALQGGRWMALQSVGLQVLSVVTTAVLARLLAPEDFGIIAITTVLIGLFSLVNAYGINASVIRRPDLDDTILSTYFWLAVLLGTAATAALMALSGVLAASFGQPSSMPYILVMAPVLLFNLVRSVPLAVLSRQLRFGPVAAVAVLDFVVYAGVAVLLAATTDIGAWAIIIGRLLGSISSLGVAFALSRWRPEARFRWGAIAGDVSFNLAVLVNGVLGFLARNLDYWVVGRLGVRALGIYYIAYLIPNVLRRRLTLASTEVMFPVLSRITDDRERLARGYLDSTRFMTLTAFPAMLGLAVIADAVITLFFGSAYFDAIQPASILAVASAIAILMSTAFPVFLADGVPQQSAAVGVLRLVVTGAGLVVAARIGNLVAVAWAVLIAVSVSVIVLQALLVRRLPMTWRDVAGSLAPAVVSSLVMVPAVLGAKRLLGESALEWPGLIVLMAVGIATYVGFGLIAYRTVFVRFFANLKSVVRSSSKSDDPESASTEATGLADGS